MVSRVAIVGMGCSRAGARSDASQEALLVEAGLEAIEDAGLGREGVNAVWACSGGANQALVNFSLKLGYTPYTGAQGPDVLRCACNAIASGAYDTVMAIAMEKPGDGGWTDLSEGGRHEGGALGSEEVIGGSRPAAISALYLTRYAAVYGLPPEKLRQGLSHIVTRSRRAGAKNPNAAVRAPIGEGELDASQRSAGLLTVADCAYPADGAAAAIICTEDTARRLGRRYVVLEGYAMATGGGRLAGVEADFTGLPEVREAARRAYEMAGVTRPQDEIDHVQIFDTTAGAELIAYEDLGLAPRGQAVDYLLAGAFDPEGSTPANTDGGLLCNGYQPGASAVRQVYESYLQLTGRVGERQVPGIRRSLVHTLGGSLGTYSAAVQIFGHAG